MLRRPAMPLLAVVVVCAVVVSAAGAQGLELSVEFDGRHATAELQPLRPFAAGARTVWLGDVPPKGDLPAEYFSGHLRGEAGSRVRISRRGGTLTGIAVSGAGVFHLSATRRAAAKARPAVAATRVARAVARGQCGVTHVPPGHRGPPLPALGGSAGDVLRRARVGIVADYEFFQAHGAAAAAVAQDAVAFAGAIYEADLGVGLEIGNTVVFTTGADPFSAADANALLDQMAAYRAAPGGPMAGSDVAHLFTGRDLTGSVIGIAWLGSLCDPRYGTGVSQNVSPASLPLVVAHEIGHNFGAGHDPLRCLTPPDGFLMQPNLACVGRHGFSNGSRNDIAAVIAAAQCLESGPPGTPTPTRTFTRTPVPGTATATNSRAPTRTPTPTGPTRTPTPTPPFSPAGLNGLVLWLDAGQLPGLTDGAAVQSWNDRRGGSLGAHQGTAGFRPTYRSAVIDRWPAVVFDGVDDHLTMAATLTPGYQKRTVVLVGRAAAAAEGAMIDLGNLATPGAGFLVTTAPAVRTGTGERSWIPGAAADTAAISIVRLNGVSTQYLASWVNGTRLAVAGITVARVATAGGTTIGASTAHRAAGPYHFAGALAEVLVYNRGLTEGERERLENHFSAKYGIGLDR